IGAGGDGRAAPAGGAEGRPAGEDHAVSAEALAFGERREPALLPAFVLAALVHLFLAAVMFLGVHWQSHPPETVVVELWEAPPAPAPAPVEEAPKPPPPKLEPEPVQKPDIAVKA